MFSLLESVFSSLAPSKGSPSRADLNNTRCFASGFTVQHLKNAFPGRSMNSTYGKFKRLVAKLSSSSSSPSVASSSRMEEIKEEEVDRRPGREEEEKKLEKEKKKRYWR